MDQAYALEYRNLYQRHWWWRAREEFILETLQRELSGAGGNEEGPVAAARDRSILDVGCGDGLFFDRLQSLGQVMGVEGDPNTMSPEGRWRDQIHCQWFDRRFRPSRQFDCILMLDILEHMPDPVAALEHARSLMKPDGFLVATVPAFMALWTSHDEVNHHEIRYTKSSFHPLVENAGFRLTDSTYLYHWTCPVKLAIRAKEWLFTTSTQPPSVPPSWLNALCLGLSKLEQATISRWSLPFGSSLMVVARADG